MPATDTQAVTPLTTLKEEELLFRAAVRDFAEDTMAPWRPQWTKKAVSSQPCCPSYSTSV